MPYSKLKGRTIEQVLSEDPGFAEFLHGAKLEQGQLGDTVFLALQTAMESRNLVPPLDEQLEALPEPVAAVPVTPQVAAAVAAPAPAAVSTNGGSVSAPSSNMVKLLAPDGSEVMVPPTVVDTMLKQGFTEPQETPTAPSDSEPCQVSIGGTVVEMPYGQAKALVDSGTADWLRAEDSASEPEMVPEPPKLPLPDEVVGVTIGGAAVEMPYVQAGPLVDSGTAEFVDSDVAEAHKRASNQESANVQAAAESPTGTVGGVTPDPNKPFACEFCDYTAKTKGALTAHKNKQHSGPQPPAAPTPVVGDSVAERVKGKIPKAPFARDFQRMVKIFEEEVGEKNFNQMSEEQMLKLEIRIDREIEEANA
jgi:hypothetical protein